MFGRTKTPKTQEQDKCCYMVYHPYSLPAESRKWEGTYHQVTSIDPSLKNFGLRVERRHQDGRIETLAFSRTSFVLPVERRKKGDEPVKVKAAVSIVCDLYEKANALLNPLLPLITQSHFIIMERQLPQNYKAVRLSQHLISYITDRVRGSPLMPIIVEIDSKVKAKYLGCPRGLNERQTKIWLIEKACQLLEWRQDLENLALIRNSKKKDDLADTVCQAEAFFKLIGLPTTKVPEGAKQDVPMPALLQPIDEPKKKTKKKKDTQSSGLVHFLLNGTEPPAPTPAPASMAKPPAPKKKKAAAKSALNNDTEKPAAAVANPVPAKAPATVPAMPKLILRKAQ